MPATSFSRSRAADTDLGRAMIVEGAHDIHEPPPGVIFKHEYEKQLWIYFMKAKPYKEWTQADLFGLSGVVRLEYRIMQGRDKLAQMVDDGADPFDPESYACAYNKELMKVENQQRANMKALGFTRSAAPPFISGQVKRKEMEDEVIDSIGLFNSAMGAKDRHAGMLAT